MFSVDQERARNILKMAMLVTDKFTQDTYLAFAHRKPYTRAKTLLADFTAPLAAVRERDEHGTFWLKIRDDQVAALTSLLPEERDLSPTAEETRLLNSLKRGASSRFVAEVKQRIADKKMAEHGHTIRLEIGDMGADSRRLVQATLAHAAKNYPAARTHL